MTPKQQLARFLVKYERSVAKQASSALRTLRTLVPGAVELVYDNYNALVIGFGPDEKASHAVFSIAVFPKWVTLCFLQGAKLVDPGRRLRGSGNVVRNVRLKPFSVLEEPEIRALIEQAQQKARVPIDPNAKRQMVIKSISKKQRPRR